MSTDVCVGSKFHSPTPMIVRPYRLDSSVATSIYGIAAEALMKGPGYYIILCGVCSDNLTEYVKMMYQNDGKPDWENRRIFGNMIRSLGHKAWDLYINNQEL